MSNTLANYRAAKMSTGLQMADKEAKARQLLAEADKRVNSFKGMFGTLVGKSSVIEEATELYVKAGNHFKMAQKWTEAGNAFHSAAKLQWRIGEKLDYALNSVTAANCFVKCDPKKAIDCLLNAINYYEELGRLGFCGKHHVTVADWYQTHLADNYQAIQHYHIAANHFKAENSIASANKCLLNVANYWALEKNYEKAIEIYEEIGKYCIESSLLKYSATNHFTRATLCHLCIDLLNGELALKRYEDWFPAFGDSREYKFIKQMISMIENEDFDGFQQTIKVYDNVSRLDSWMVSMLLTISKKYNDQDGDLDMK